jgi:hypothetical protein
VLVTAYEHLMLTKGPKATLAFVLLAHNPATELENEKLETLARSWLTRVEDLLNQSSDTPDATQDFQCSFCGTKIRPAEKASAVAGPDVFICRDCIGLCIEIMALEAPQWFDEKIAAVQAPRDKTS